MTVTRSTIFLPQVCTIQHLPRRGHMPHGPSLRPAGSGGSRAEGVPRGRPQGGRHLHHARDHVGQHSRSHHDDWGEMCRHDQTDLWVGRIQELRMKMVSSSGVKLLSGDGSVRSRSEPTEYLVQIKVKFVFVKSRHISFKYIDYLSHCKSHE